MRCNFFSNFLRVTFERKVLRLTNTVSRFAGDYSSRVSGEGTTLGEKLERKNGRKGKGRGSARHGTGGQAVTEFIVLRCSYTEGRFVPPTMPRSSSLTSRGRLSSPSCRLLPLLLLGRHAASLSLSHADPLERTRFYLSLSPVNGLCRPAPRFSIVFLSLSIFLSFGFTFSPLIIARLRS